MIMYNFQITKHISIISRKDLRLRQKLNKENLN